MKQYPLSYGIFLHRHTGYTVYTNLHTSIQYYTLELDDKSKYLCTIATPFGKFKYNRLPMKLTLLP
jgi:hypothetical protein